MNSSRKKILILGILTLLSVGVLWYFAAPVLAQNLDTGLNFAADTGLSAQDPRVTIARIIRIALGFLGIIAVALIMYAGFIWMTAKGEEEKIEKAKKIMVSASIGLVIILASFAIASFVMTRLQSATGGNGGGGGGGGGGIGGGSDVFAISGTTPAHQSVNVIRNTVIRFRFTKDVKPATVNATTFAVTANGAVAGTISTNGKFIEFVPSANCEAPNEALKCFDKNVKYTVTVQNGTSGIISVDDKELSCLGTSNCKVEFTTGEIIDTEAPHINITTVQVCQAVDNTLSASSIDNYGVSKIDFFSNANPAGSVINNSNPFVGSPFDAEVSWSAEGYGESVLLKATAYDLDSNQATAEKNVPISPAHCCNGVQDGDETGVDCGGSCASCEAMNRPIISRVGPMGGFCSNNPNTYCRKATEVQDCGANANCDLGTPNGANGNFVTILGSGFGEFQAGKSKVFFTDANGQLIQAVLADDSQLGNPSCTNSVWQDGQIIAVVPVGAANGKIQIQNANGTIEATDDEFGPLINNFKKNTIDRPGICALTPVGGKLNDVVEYNGIKLTSSEAYYGNLSNNIKAPISSFNAPKQGTATVPNLTSGLTTTYVQKTNVESNFLPFTKENEPYDGPIISSIEPLSGPIGQYITVRGSGFGATKSTSKVFFGAVTGFEADYSFPQICAESIWTDKQIVIKVPAGIPSGTSYPITIARGGFPPADSGTQTFNVSTGTPNPGICRIQPSLGQANSEVTVWGEYFGANDNNSIVRFYNNQDQHVGANNWLIDQSASGIKPWKVITNVPQIAATGPVRVVISSPEKLSNIYNFTVGQCTKDADCGGSEATCCSAGLPEAGKCKANASECYGSVANSVYEWRFSTGSTSSCAADQETCGTTCCARGTCENASQSKCRDCAAGQGQCGNGECCSPGGCKVIIEGQPSVCQDPPSCSGYTYNQCIEGYFCPNSPGKCSPTAPTGGVVEVGTCGNSNCDALPGCNLVPGSCNYDSILNRCVKTAGLLCKKIELRNNASQVIKLNNQPVAGTCDNFQGNPHWFLTNWSQSCPAGWTRTTNNRCVDVSNINGACSKCLNPLSCQSSNSDGKCGVSQPICPSGSTCNATNNKCEKQDQGTCDCCCRKDNSAQDCCAGLSCDGSCGSGDQNLGLCSGCVVGGVPDDSLCNCTGSTGKYCDATGGNTRGVCKDCSSITDPTECSSHAQCCVDGKNGGRCTSVVPNQPNGGRVEDKGLQYCAYYNCTNQYPNSCNVNPVTNGVYNKLNSCNSNCTAAPISCANSFGQCDKNSPCPANMHCDALSCECKSSNPGPGVSCRNPLTQACTGSCTVGYQCLLPSGYNGGGNSPQAGSGEPGQDTCRCCCKPPTGNEQDSCKLINSGLDCLADQGACTSPTGERGLCCGCTSDGMCGDVLTTGCGLTGSRCCQTRPTVTSKTPAVDEQGVCRNTVVEAVFNQNMDITSLSDNVRLIGDYGAATCPSDTSPVALAPQNESRFAKVLKPFKQLLAKVFPAVLTNSAFAQFSHYCYVPGSVVGYDLNANQTKVSFHLTRPLEANTTFYVALMGDPALAELGGGSDEKQYYNDNIVNLARIGMIGVASRSVPLDGFNYTELKNAEIWPFKTGNDICTVSKVSVAPSFKLFQRSGQKQIFESIALDQANRPIQSIPTVYAWTWDWSSDNSDIAQVVEQTQEYLGEATSGNKQDAQTLARAKATIVKDTVNNPSTERQTTDGTARIRLFLCENPWPVYSTFPPEYSWPWKDQSTGIEFYYCRDKSGVGTIDDLPALVDEPVVKEGGRKICMYGANVGRTCTSDANCSNIANSCLPEVLKEFFFFRENEPGIPNPAGTADPLGNKITLTWDDVPGAAKYKVYYGLNARQYTFTSEVVAGKGQISTTISNLVNGLNYHFAVTALSSKNQESAFSVEVVIKPADTTPPAIPNLQASAGDGQISLFWPKVPDAVSYIAYFSAQPRGNGQYSNSTVVTTDPLPNIPNTIFSSINGAGLNNTVPYYVSVRSVDQYGNLSDYAPEIEKRPNQPYLVSTTPGNGSVTLSWLPFIGATGYTIYYGENSRNLTSNVSVSSSTYSRKISGLTNGTTYYFAIRATKSATTQSDLSNQRSQAPAAGGLDQ